MATIFSFSQLKPKASPMPPPRELAQPRDWTNQELSDLYRAIASLGQSGISVEMDRGLTDEGDPWMVLCRLDGEVFIHFCRLDGQYLLDSPVLPRPLRGCDFAELVDLFIAQASRAAAPNVVAFRASKVFLHPAALLTILVWSLYVWSSDTSEAQASELDDGAIAPCSQPISSRPIRTPPILRPRHQRPRPNRPSWLTVCRLNAWRRASPKPWTTPATGQQATMSLPCNCSR